MKVKKRNLLFLACLVWAIAGFNVLRIGVITYPPYLGALNLALSGVVFLLFQRFVFGPLVKKHTARILAYEEERQYFWNFFDLRSFLIMAFMMTFGIVLRAFRLAPDRFIAVFYTGLGASLLLAGILFGKNYVFALRSASREQGKADQNISSNKGVVCMTKRYMNISLIYSILAMVGGVFYREFTKFNGFEGKTALGVVHTHYFMLGVVFFLLLLVLEKNFGFSTAKSGKVLAVYHVGLNLTCIMFLVRGILQVLGTQLTKGASAAISGVAGIGHILLGVSLVLALLQVKKSIA